mmetsp:Transcript_158837/g.509252  ORF Transcript_158837/g.509252 Transcript_158837/m.509252 type:complete len:166 (+) Transcript_158837:445-942(+)
MPAHLDQASFPQASVQTELQQESSHRRQSVDRGPLPSQHLASAGHRIQRSEGAELSTARGWRGGGGVPSGGRSSSKEKGGRTSLSGGTQVAVVMLCSAALRSAFPHAKPLKGLLLALDLLPPRTTPKVPAAGLAATPRGPRSGIGGRRCCGDDDRRCGGSPELAR